MKHILSLCVAALLGVMACSADTYCRDMSQLPATIQKEVKANFKSNFVVAKIENKASGKEYEIKLADGTEIKYENNQWEEVDMPKGMAVPAVYVPAAINNYVAANCPGQSIRKIDKDRKGYEVKLSNGKELKFDTAGSFLKYDR